MKISYIKLKNYLAIYNGMKTDTVEINFNNVSSRLIVIKGPNGSGKSSLLNALHPMNDPNYFFIPNKKAYKIIYIEDNNILYKIRHIHDIKSNGERSTTKSYITKVYDGIEVELNENGNVNGFKDVLYSEFDLDNNYLALTKLTSEDKGIVDKLPSERKRLITSILSEVEVYNDIHKTLNKRTAVFKSFVNTITAKMEIIGDESLVKNTLVSIENRLNSYERNKTNIISSISEMKAKIDILDPNKEIQNSYNIIKNNLIEYDNSISILNKKIDRYKIDYKSEKELSNRYIEINNVLSTIDTNNKILENEIKTNLSIRENQSKELTKKIAQLDSMKIDINMNIIEQYNYTSNKIKELESIFNTIGCKEVNITKNEFLLGLDILKDIKSTINDIKSFYYKEEIDQAINNIKTNTIYDITRYDEKYDNLLEEKNKLEDRLNEYNNLSNISSILDARPKECKIDDCPFIREGLLAKSKLSSLGNNISRDINNISDKLNILKEEKKTKSNINECFNMISRLLRWIDSNINIFNKLPNMKNIINRNILLERFKNNDQFKEIDILYSYIQQCDIFDEYNILINNLKELSIEREKYNERSKFIDSISMDIDSLRDSLKSYDEDVLNSRESIKKNLEIASNLKSEKNILEEVININTELDSLLLKRKEEYIKYNNIKENMNTISIFIEDINKLQYNLKELSSTITSLSEDRDKLKHNLSLMNEYKSELRLYQERYEKILVIKDACNPNKDSIQMIFAKLYLDKTINLTNELLQMIFEGKYKIIDYIINDNEFRIPILGDGYPRDDISSLSLSQKSLISMIVGLVLLKQSSSKYNILRLDELDGNLDEYNRTVFITLLEQLIDLLGVEQCFIISHNNELDLDKANLILINQGIYSEYKGDNIIYSN